MSNLIKLLEKHCEHLRQLENDECEDSIFGLDEVCEKTNDKKVARQNVKNIYDKIEN